MARALEASGEGAGNGSAGATSTQPESDEMAITLVINGVSQTVESGAAVAVSRSDRIQIQVNGLVIDPTTIVRDVNPPDVTLSLPDGQTV